MKVPASLALLLPMVACTPAKTPAVTPARVFFVAPAEGIVAATGKRVEGEAHHHLFIDTDPTADTVMIPKNDAIRHLGTGADTISLVLAPGTHRIIAVAAWGDHVPVAGAVRDTVTIEVPAPVIKP